MCTIGITLPTNSRIGTKIFSKLKIEKLHRSDVDRDKRRNHVQVWGFKDLQSERVEWVAKLNRKVI